MFPQNKPKKSNTPIISENSFSLFSTNSLIFSTKTLFILIKYIFKTSFNPKITEYLTE